LSNHKIKEMLGFKEEFDWRTYVDGETGNAKDVESGKTKA
jgi:hypothetical protein